MLASFQLGKIARHNAYIYINQHAPLDIKDHRKISIFTNVVDSSALNLEIARSGRTGRRTACEICSGRKSHSSRSPRLATIPKPCR